ncbi:GGDEF domain-containing protein [Halomonas binhaiensis]|uniref:diguanylate cyclase n=1 Tax=Halomonas binhaiensis TaxID=2562282 RepID=A0A5C1NI43_9GAMM|nr:GGDEF domain-containing protein [Halomonas binhaiensis]QEM82986.1 GGDEF domain-containing protein [Halomonas binhaiensis]
MPPFSVPELNVVLAQEYRKSVLVQWTAVLGALAHLSFIPLFWVYGHPYLALLNVLSVSMWCASLVANYKGAHRLAIYLIATEAYGHAAIVTIVLGNMPGFHYYLLPLACLAALSPAITRWKSALLGMLGMLLFILLERLPDGFTPVEDAPGLPPAMATINLTAALAGMVCFVIIISYLIEKQERSLTKIATRDALTGLFNRRFATDYLRQLMEQQRRSPSPCCLALIDVDHFKLINDEYGHRVGDKCLVQIADMLTTHFRRSDTLCRWGGEEFLLIFPGAGQREMLPVIESFRERLRTQPLRHQGEQIIVTISVGLTNVTPGTAPDALVNQADSLLYQAKAEGRDRIVSGSVKDEPPQNVRPRPPGNPESSSDQPEPAN